METSGKAERWPRFEIRRLLGSGGMGVVYAAFDRQRSAEVALKVMRQAEPRALHRFKQEFRALADLHHPNLVSLYELVRLGDDWALTMELIDGVSFGEHIGGPARDQATAASRLDNTTCGTMPGKPAAAGMHEPRPPSERWYDEGRLRSALPQLAEGIAALHAAGCLHRDIKPSNVLVAHTGRVALCDFGLVRTLAPGPELDAGIVIGTTSYMSPEQAGQRPLTEASDWYSFGVLLHVVLTGRAPFDGSADDVLRFKTTMDPPPVRRLDRDAPHDLASLCDDLLRRDPGERPSGAEVLMRLGSASTTMVPATTTRVFVGRRTELARLDDALASARVGHLTIALVHGPSGVGKSALIRHFAAAVRANGQAALLGRCYERESVPYKAFDTVLDEVTALLAGLPEAEARSLVPADAGVLTRMFPVLGRLGGLLPPAPLHALSDPTALRRQASAALRALLAGLAARRPTVLWIDDVQWADVDSARLLGDVLAPPGAPPLLVVLSYRSEARCPALDVILDNVVPRSGAAVVDVPVPPLPEAAASELAWALLRGQSTDAEQRALHIARESGGSPLFVAELVRHVQAGGAADASVTLESVLHARLGRLSSDEAALLATIAVASRPIAQGIAADAAVVAEWRDAIHALRAGHLVRTLGDDDTDRVETFHDRVRETVLGSLPAAALASRHAALARAYEARGQLDAEILAEHWWAAGDGGRAASYAQAAADHAARALAFDRAARLYQLALDLAMPADAPRLRRALADALVNAGRGADAAEAYLAAAEEDRDPGTALALRRRAAEQWLLSGHVDRGLGEIARVLGAVGERLAATPLRALISLALRRAWLRLRGLEPHDPAPASDAARERLDILWAVATGLSLIDNIRGADFQARYLAGSLAIGDPLRIARGLAIETAFVAAGGSRARARSDALGARAMAQAEALGDPYTLGLAQTTSGVVAFLNGDWADAASRCRDGRQLLRAHCPGRDWESWVGAIFELGAFYFSGDLVALIDGVPARLAEAEARGNLHAATQLRTWYCNSAWLALDRPDEAERQIERARRDWSRAGYHLQHHYVLMAQLQLDLYRGDGVAGLARIRSEWRPMGRSLMRQIELVDVEAHQLRARCALACAQATGDAGALADAARSGRRIGRIDYPYTQGFAALIAAGCAAIRGDDAGALTALGDAEAAFERGGMRAYLAATRLQRGRRLRGHTGALLAERARTELVMCGARDPERLAATLAPGLS